MSQTLSKTKPVTIFAEDIMTEIVDVINQKMLIGQVAHLMLRNRVSGYPVVNDRRRVVGIITLTDLLTLLDRIVDENKNKTRKKTIAGLHKKITEYKDLPVAQFMSKNVINLSPKTPLDEIISAVANWNIHTFPVMEGRKLVGIIGRHDIINATFTFG